MAENCFASGISPGGPAVHTALAAGGRLRLAKLDVDANKELAAQLRVQAYTEALSY